MRLDEFIQSYAEFLRRQPCIRGFDEVHIIVNPAAGGFTQRGLYRKIIDSFLYWNSQPPNPEKTAYPGSIHIHWTESPGHCERITGRIIKNGDARQRCLIITAGGDGTATEAAGELHAWGTAGGKIDNIVLFRLPLGTGNDGLDAANMNDALRLAGGPCALEKIPLLQIDFASGIRKYATNVGSFGLDAYVTVKANSLKKILPGSFYASMVDVAALFYDRTVPMVPYMITYEDFSGKTGHLELPLLLLAMGVSGNRNYGGGQKVLPDSRNVCTVGPMKLKRKFTVKKLFYHGRHTELDEVKMFDAKKLTLDFPHPLLFQYDGEVLQLKREDFPVTMSVLEPEVQVMRAGSSAS